MSTGRPNTWMPLYWGDYLKDTTDLTAKEHGVYLLLLGWYWTNGGPLDDDQKRLARVAKLDDENDETLAYVLDRFFVLSRGRWKQKRVEFELERAMRISSVRRKAGKTGGLASGEARSNNEANDEANGKLKATPSQSQLHKKESNPQTPLEGGKKDLQTKQERFPPLDRLPSSSSGREYPPPFEDFWTAWRHNPNDTKASAYKSWRGAVNGKLISIGGLLIAARVKADIACEPKYRPHVQTWINREGWTAEGGNGADKLPGATRDAQGVWRDMAGGAMSRAEVERARELAERVPP